MVRGSKRMSNGTYQSHFIYTDTVGNCVQSAGMVLPVFFSLRLSASHGSSLEYMQSPRFGSTTVVRGLPPTISKVLFS